MIVDRLLAVVIVILTGIQAFFVTLSFLDGHWFLASCLTVLGVINIVSAPNVCRMELW